jgi:hypothetical protein
MSFWGAALQSHPRLYSLELEVRQPKSPGHIMLLSLLSLLLLQKTTQPIRLLARESFRNAISKLQNIVYVILLVNHIHQAAQVRIR